MTKRFKLDGQRDPDRRRAVEEDRHEIVLPHWAHNGDGPVALGWEQFIKTVPTYAIQLPVAFEVDTLEGLHTADAGDYLAVGSQGEMYPIRQDIFVETYRKAYPDE